MRAPLLTSFLLLLAFAIAFGLFVDRRADFRAAEIEARFPPRGEFVEVNGRKMHVLVKGSGPDLVLIHAAGSNVNDTDLALGDRLAEHYRVFLVDRPGHGWSERLGPEFEGPFNANGESPIEQARALSAAVQKLGARDPIVVGHSMGGAVAMGWAVSEPASAIVVISAPTMPWPGGIDASYRVLGSGPGGALIAPLAAAFVPRSYVDTTISSVFQPQSPPPNYVDAAGIMLATRTGALRANNRQVRNLRPFIVEQSKLYPNVTLPVEILHGTEDQTAYHTIHAEPMAALLPDANLTLLHGIGHMPHHIVPDDVFAAIERAATRAGLR